MTLRFNPIPQQAAELPDFQSAAELTAIRTAQQLLPLQIDDVAPRRPEPTEQEQRRRHRDRGEPYPPVAEDLFSIAEIIRKTRRVNAVEYGVGHSTKVIAETLLELTDQDKVMRSLNVVDASNHYISRAMVNIPSRVQAIIETHVVRPFNTNWNNQWCSEYPWVPPINPDFIYIDAPEPYQVDWDRDADAEGYPPISCDVLQIEPYLLPLTVVLIDGRAMQARFLFQNFKRHWKYRYLQDRDQHVFVLDEGWLGMAKHEQFVNDVYYLNGRWSIEDL